MKTNQIPFSTILWMAFLVTACSGAATPDVMMDEPGDTMAAQATPTSDAMMAQETPTPDTMMAQETPIVDAMSNPTATPEVVVEVPAWFGIPLTDVRTGTVFTIQDLKGKVVLVEPMAVWCSKCLSQQERVKTLHEVLGHRDDFVSIGLDIDPNEDASYLKGFIDREGFDWLYAVSPVDLAREIASLYGDQFLNPPSTPMLLIDRDGEVHLLPFGIKSTDELLQFVQPFLDESM